MSSKNFVAQVSQREFWVRTIIGLALAAASAAMITLSFAPYNLWPLIWIGFVPGLLAQYRIMPKRLSGLAAGVYVGGFIWGYLGPVFADGIWYMKYLWLIIGVIITLVTIGAVAFQECTRYRWFVLQGVAAWVSVEMIRIFIPVAGTWGFVSYALYQQPWLIQPVSIFGIFGLDVLIMLVNYALAQGAILLYDRLSLTKRAFLSGLHWRCAGSSASVLRRRSGSEKAMLVADVPLGRSNALQTRLGDWVGWLSLARSRSKNTCSESVNGSTLDRPSRRSLTRLAP